MNLQAKSHNKQELFLGIKNDAYLRDHYNYLVTEGSS